MSQYIFRNAPCTVGSHGETWYVAGKFIDEGDIGSGILEWCYDRDDALALKSEMQKDPRFSKLSVGRDRG